MGQLDMDDTLNENPPVEDVPDELGPTTTMETLGGGEPGNKEERLGDKETTKSSPQETPEPAKNAPPEARLSPTKDYGWQWEWDEDAKDYIHKTDTGRKLLYTAYQRTRGDADASEYKPSTPPRSKSPNTTAEKLPQVSSPRLESGWVKVDDFKAGAEDLDKDTQNIRSPPSALVEPPKALPPSPSKKRAFEESLDDRLSFSIVATAPPAPKLYCTDIL